MGVAYERGAGPLGLQQLEDEVNHRILLGVWVTVLAVHFAGSTVALACAGGFLQALMFHKYPEAKTTTMAIAKARMHGTLKGDEWSRSSGKSIHAWRSERTKVTIRALQTRLNSTVKPSASLINTNVFLLNEFTWLSITTDGKRITVSRQPFGLRISGPKVFTSRRVIDNLLESSMTWQEAIGQGLITSRCASHCSSNQRYGLLSFAMATPRKHSRASSN